MTTVEIVVAIVAAFVGGMILVQLIHGFNRFLDRQEKLRNTDFFEGSAKDVYDKAEAKVMKQRTHSAWSG